VPAVHGSLGRFGFGSLGLLAVLLFYRPWPALTAGLFGRLAAMGLFGVFFYNICFFNGLQTVPAGRASMVASMQPMFVFLFSALVWGEKVTPLKVTGLLVSLSGAVLTGKIPAVAATAYSTWLGTTALVAYAALQPPPAAPWSPKVWLAAAFLGWGGTTAAFLLYLKGIGQIGPSRASIFINLVPVFGVILSSVFLGEAVSGATLLGGAVVIVGVRLLNR